MSNSEPVTVRIGDQELRITRFRGLKAILAGALVARVMRELPEIQDRVSEFTKKYRAKNTLTITPVMAKMPRFLGLGLTPEDFQAAEGGNIELPEEPSAQQVMIALMPDLFDLARKETMRFLALIAIPNSELEKADDADDVEGALDVYAKTLFRNGEIQELLELLVVGWEVMEAQILSKDDRLGKLKNLPFLKGWLFTPEEEEESQEELTPQMSLDDVPTSSTSSDDDTDGIDEQPSMEPLGTSS